MPRRKQRTPDLRDQVLVAAVAVLESEGQGALTARRVAAEAGTSTAAVYELFGAKGGLVRAIFFEGFRMLGRQLQREVRGDGGLEPVRELIAAMRRFILARPALARVMFERPFADFDPGPDEIAAGAAVREFVIGRARQCVEAGLLAGDPADIAHVLIGLVLGLAAQESAGWLGSSRASADRRWSLSTDAMLRGLTSAPD